MVKDNPSGRGGGGRGKEYKWSVAKTRRVFINTGGRGGGISCGTVSAGAAEQKTHGGGEGARA